MKKDTPYIQLFTSPNSYYVFDVNRNELLELDKDSYTYLLDLLAGRETAEAPEMIRSLREEGYLSSNRVSTVQHPYTPYLADILDRSVEQLTLQVTQNCNFRCSYCNYTQSNGGQRAHSSKHMTEETARKALRFLRDHSADSPEVTIGFYGGEPLIEFPLIQRLVAYADEIFLGKKHSYTLTTNATLLTDPMIEFFEQNHFSIVISLDGPQDINDKNRVFASGEGTYRYVIEKLNHIAEKYPDFFRKHLSLNMVLDPANPFEEISRIFKEEAVMKQINFQSTVIDDTYAPEPTVYADAYRSQYQYLLFLVLLSELDRFPAQMTNPIVRSHMQATKEAMEKIAPQAGLSDTFAPGGPCIPGKMRVFVTVDGDLFPCERVSETSDALRIGTLDSGYNIEQAKAILNIGALTPDICRNCWAFTSCDICCKRADNGCLDAKTKLQHCEESRRGLANNLLMMIFFKEAHAVYPQKGGSINE